MADALEKVRRDLGRDAIILHTRSLRRGGILGVGARTVVEITASRDPRALNVSERRVLAGAGGGATGTSERFVASLRTEPSGLADSREPVERSSLRDATPPSTRRPPPGAEAAFRRQFPENRVSRQDPPPDKRDFGAVTDDLHQEMAEIRAMVRELLERPAVAGRRRTVRPSAAPDAARRPPCEAPAELQTYYTRLLQNAVAEELADEILATARERLAECRTRIALAVGERMDKVLLDQKVREKLSELVPAVLTETVERMLPADGPVEVDPDGGPRVIALVGPTGVGKTTTVAKLAAHFKLRENRRVGLITTDTYRIAAVEQLKAYAQIMDVPLEVVFEPGELEAAFDRLADCDLVLVDTSGRSHRDTARIQQLGCFLEASRAAAVRRAPSGPAERGGMEVHLLLSCASDESQLLEVAERFAVLDVDRVVFTKLDEAVGLGVLLNVASRLKWRLSYLTTGQEVPHDIEVGRRRRVAELILNGWRTAGAPSSESPV